jgi:hypothetical protein
VLVPTALDPVPLLPSMFAVMVDGSVVHESHSVQVRPALRPLVMRPVKGGLHAVKSVLGCDYHTHDDGRRPFLVLELEWEEIVNDAHSVTFEPFDGEGISALPCVKAYMQLSATKTKIKKLQSQACSSTRGKRIVMLSSLHRFTNSLSI